MKKGHVEQLFFQKWKNAYELSESFSFIKIKDFIEPRHSKWQRKFRKLLFANKQLSYATNAEKAYTKYYVAHSNTNVLTQGSFAVFSRTIEKVVRFYFKCLRARSTKAIILVLFWKRNVHKECTNEKK